MISTDRLVEELWADQPPPTAAKTVQVYVSHLRKALGNGVLETHGHGYAIKAGSAELDLDRFEATALDARTLLEQGDPAAAAARFREALALWSGEPLADLAYEPFAQREIRRLGDLRLAVVEEWLDAELAAGNHDRMVLTLQELVSENPLRDRMRAQLMLALYRSGRQADALEAYRQARRTMVEELGIEPGRHLQELEQQILTQDPQLDLPSPQHGLAAAFARPSIRSSTRLVMAGATLLLVAAIAAGVVALSGHTGKASLALVPPNAVGRIDPRTGAIVSQVSVPGKPGRLAAAGGQLLVGSDASETLSSVSEARLTVSQLVAPRAFPGDLALGEGGGWLVDGEAGLLVEVNPSYGSVTRKIRLATPEPNADLEDRSSLENPWSVAAGLGGVWVTDGSRSLARVDPAGGRIATRIEAGAPLNGVTVGAGAVWAISGRTAEVLRIDPRTARVTTRIPIVSRPGFESPYPIAIAVGQGSVWVLNANTATVTRIDPSQRGVTTTIPVGIDHEPTRLAVGAGSAWVANGDGTLERIDARTGSAKTFPVAHRLNDVVVGRSGVWVTAGSGLTGRAPTASSAAGEAAVTPLPSSTCSPVYSAPGARPQVLVASDLPLQGAPRTLAEQMNEAVLFMLRSEGFRAGRFAVGYQACNDATLNGPQSVRKCSSVASAYAADRSVVGIIGPYNSACSVAEVPIANRAPAGPLPLIAQSVTYVGLTRRGPATAPGEPQIYYPRGTRNFVRIVPADDIQAAANAVLAKQLGRRRVYVLDVPPALGGPYGVGIANDFRASAPRVGLEIAGTAGWDPRKPRYVGLARRIARSGADAVFLGGALDANGGQVLRDLRSVLPRSVQSLAPDGFAVPDLVPAVSAAGEGMTVSVPGVVPEALAGRGRQFVSQFRAAIGEAPQQYSVNAAQATEILLDAIRRSNGTRASVNRQLFATRVRGGLLGNFDITPSGDTTSTAVTIYRVTGGRLQLLRVVTPPPSLVKGFTAR